MYYELKKVDSFCSVACHWVAVGQEKVCCLHVILVDFPEASSHFWKWDAAYTVEGHLVMCTACVSHHKCLQHVAVLCGECASMDVSGYGYMWHCFFAPLPECKWYKSTKPVFHIAPLQSPLYLPTITQCKLMLIVLRLILLYLPCAMVDGINL